MTLLSVENVSMHFGGVVTVEHVSLTVRENQLLGFIGPNGAGKTTLMHIITGILRPQKGRVVFRGKDLTRWPIHLRVRFGLALAQQIVRPLKSLSLTDNVALAAGLQNTGNPLKAFLKSDRTKEREKSRELLEFVGLGDVANSMPSQLPLGYIKRLEIARALALKPQLLLLDEPLAGLNQKEAEGVADLISSLVTHQCSVLIIEHNIREITRICPEIYVQNNGHRLLQGSTDQVMASPELRQAYLGRGTS